MRIFRYDKSFEGLLTAVFDAYARKTFPDKLLGPDDPLPLFVTECHQVVTDSAKADRVWRGVYARSSREVCHMLSCVWLSEMPACEELLLRYLRKMFDGSPAVVTDFSDPDVLAVKKLADKVMREREYMLMFVRFQQAADGTFFAPVNPRYNVLPLVVRHFSDRFADQRWLIYDVGRRYGYYYEQGRATEITLTGTETQIPEKLTEAQMADEERLFQQLWKNYFEAIAIRERINPTLQRRNMPRRFWRYLTEKQ